MTAWLLLVLSGALIVACGVFVAGEFALLTADRTAVEAAAARGDRRAKGVLAALRTLSTQLSGVQVAITLTNLAIGFLSEPALAELLRSPLRGLGLGRGAVEAVAVGVALVLSTVLTMIFGELVPKNLAIALPLPVARAVQGPVRAFTRVARLPIRALNAAANVVLGLFGLEAQEELAAGRSPDELLSLVRHSARKGTLDQGTASLLVRSLTFGGKRARDVLTARPLMVTVAASASVTEVLDVVRTSGHARLPVTGPAGLDEVVGVIELDQAVAVEPVRRPLATAAEVMSAVLEVPESLPLDRVLAELQRARTQVALVVDEYGGTAGWLTGEDLLEELVGELDDEHDSPSPAVRALSDGYDVPGLLRPDEVTAVTGLMLPAQGIYETVGGLVMQRLARIPVVGDRVVVDGVALTVAAMDGHRVERLHVTAVPDDDGAEPATDGGGA